MMASQSWVLWYSIFPVMTFPVWAESYSSVGWMMLFLFVGTRDLYIYFSYKHQYNICNGGFCALKCKEQSTDIR